MAGETAAGRVDDGEAVNYIHPLDHFWFDGEPPDWVENILRRKRFAAEEANMPRWDFKCPECQHIAELVYSNVQAADAAWVVCVECEGERPMERLPAAPNFDVQGYSAKNGYSK